MSTDIDKAALDYHRWPVPGKIAIETTKSMLSQHDLSLAYTPGVAAVCEAITADPDSINDYTARGNLVAVITNGSAVLGLGDIGPRAAKPVMEGKAALFKAFAGIDVYDLELDEPDPARFVDAVAALAPTFGGINLEDIKAPECFEIERRLSERLDIPVFHDDQHGTAICVAAAVHNGLRLANKRLADVRLVCSGAGAAALACLDLLVSMGLDSNKVFVCDRHGVVYAGRDIEEDPYKSRYARDTGLRSLQDVMPGADIFLGLSVGDVLDAASVSLMAANPLILALANPDPEIKPEAAHAVRDDVIMATGRSDYPNQVNNVLCFPFLFRGALDVCATTINQEMKIACVEALADLALEESSDSVTSAYSGQTFRFSRDYLLPKPFDRRLIVRLAVRVAEAAMQSGVAKRPLADIGEYRQQLEARSYRTSTLMRPIFDRARQHPRRIMFAEGESLRVLHAVQVIVDENLCMPVLVGRRDQILHHLEGSGLRLEPDRDFEIVDPLDNSQLTRDRESAAAVTGSENPDNDDLERLLQDSGTALAAIRLRRRMVDAVLCGVSGDFNDHLSRVRSLIGCEVETGDLSTVNLVITRQGPLFITDTRVSMMPSAEHLVEAALQATRLVRYFGINPRVALLASPATATGQDMNSGRIGQAVRLLQQRAPDLPVTVAVSLEQALTPDDELDRINLLVMPSLDAASAAVGVMKTLGNSVDIGPILTGTRYPIHVLGNNVSVRGIVNMAALAAADN